MNSDGAFMDSSHEPIAIVGMSCRFPGANNVNEYWELLLNKVDAMRTVPVERWTSEKSCIVQPEHANVLAGFLNYPVDKFDSEFFGMSPAVVMSMDPQTRLALQLSWEALEDANISPSSLRGKDTSVYLGYWRVEYRDLMLRGQIENSKEEIRQYLGCSVASGASKISQFLALNGPCLSIDTGCASSLVCVGLAMQALRNRETGLALVGGLNLILKPFLYEDFQGLLSPEGHCKSFEESANGFARAEGCAVLVLKRLSDALSDGDVIHGVLRGYGIAQEAVSTSVGTPTAEMEERAINLAFQNAQVTPEDLDFVEMHCTGTKVGDPIEFSATMAAFNLSNCERSKPLFLGAGKANIGHTEACSGIAGLIKTMLSMRHEHIPPQRTLDKINPKFGAESFPIVIPNIPISWERSPSRTRIAGVSSFGITGCYAHVIIAEPPPKQVVLEKMPPQENFPMILTISTKSESALTQTLEQYQNLLNEADGSSQHVANICYTAAVGRAHFQTHRAVIIASNTSHLTQIKEQRQILRSPIRNKSSKLCFLFPGIGTHYVGMGKKLYNSCTQYKLHFDLVTNMIDSLCNIDFKSIIFEEGSSTAINENSQLCVFAVQYSLLKVWEFWGVEPSVVLGHSLGEFSASVCTGALSLNLALRMLMGGKDGLLSKMVVPGAMMVLQTDEETTTGMINSYITTAPPGHWIDIAAINACDQTVVAGDADSINGFSQTCSQMKVKTKIIQAGQPFHSRGLDAILPEYEEMVSTGLNKGGQFNKRIQYVSSMDGSVMENPGDLKYWVKHLRQPVQFIKASSTAIETCGSTLFLEIGAHPLLSPLISQNSPEPVICIPSMHRNRDDWTTLINAVGQLYQNGVDINWPNFYASLPYCVEKVSIPHYPFQLQKSYWFQKTRQPALNNPPGTIVHPLLGSRLECAINNIDVFHAYDIDQNTNYVMDHMIGKYCIFPMAAYIEMSLAVALKTTTVQKDKLLNLENFVVHAALGIDQGIQIEMQTICQSETPNEHEREVTIHSRNLNEENSKWKLHSSGNLKFTPTLAQDVPKIDLDALQDNFSPTIQTGSEFYEQLAAFGYNFGTQFQTLISIARNADNNEAFIRIRIESGQRDYLIHPLLVDAVLQSILATFTPTMKSLLLPCTFTSFTLLSPSLTNSSDYFAHATHTGATLYSIDGSLIASLNGLQFVETNVENLGNSIQFRDLVPIPLFQEQWISTESEQLEGSFNQDEPFMASVAYGIIRDLTVTQMSETQKKSWRLYHEVIGLGIANVFSNMGWKMGNIGDIFNMTNVFEIMGVKPEWIPFCRRLVEILVEIGLFSYSNADRDVVILEKAPPSQREWEERLYESKHSLPHMKMEWEFAAFYISKMAYFLQGRESVLPILFPNLSDEDIKYSAESLYNKFIIPQTHTDMMVTVLSEILQNRPIRNRRTLRILEVGAGTGSATRKMLDVLHTWGSPYDYVFTDISPSFFPTAEKLLQKYVDNVSFKQLNLELDPQTQGFAPFQFDLIINLNVLHATKDLSRTTRFLRTLIRKHGLIMIAEQFAPLAYMDIVFGNCEGYWKYDDHHLRKKHCLIDSKTWTDVLLSSGFRSCLVHENLESHVGVLVAEAAEIDHLSAIQNPNPSGETWIIIGDPVTPLSTAISTQLINCGKNCVLFQSDTIPAKLENFQMSRTGIIYFYDSNHPSQEASFAPALQFLTTLKFITSLTDTQTGCKLYLVLQSYNHEVDERSLAFSPINGMARTLRSEYPQLSCVSLDLEAACLIEHNVARIMAELWRSHSEPFVSYRGEQRHVLKLNYMSQPKKSLPILSTDSSKGCKLVLPESKNIGDLMFQHFTRKTSENFEENDVEIQVKATGLNFEDLICILKPTTEFSNRSNVGADFAGEIVRIGSRVSLWKLGDNVIGRQLRPDPFPSHVIIEESLVTALPDHWTFTEGATLPTAFFTAFHCLITVGELSTGNWVLIHTASGGVGLCAIQIAQGLGAKVIATAGNSKKRAYLRNLGIKHVLNSRTTKYESEVWKITSGRGVDVVLNTLTGVGFKEATLKICAKNARFVEISKLNIWTNAEVHHVRPDVKYSIEDLSLPAVTRFKYLSTEMRNYISTRQIQPLPHTVFDSCDIRSALTYLENGKHIGKVVCRMPENGSTERPLLFNDRSTYLITGGLGGIGLSLAKWMGQNGAKYFLLCGRNPPNSEAVKVIDQLESKGYFVTVRCLDISDYQQCQKLINDDIFTGGNHPPLRGIFHAAGILSDGIIQNQTSGKFITVLNPKVKGSWNLHKLTLPMNLEHFVLFSSAVAIVGGPGQSNHAAANSYLDALANYRHSIGLPALSINWGHWGDVGVAVGKDYPGMKPFSSAEGMHALEMLMRTKEPQGSAFVPSNLNKNFPWMKNYLGFVEKEEDAVGMATNKTKIPGEKVPLLSSDSFWEDINAGGDIIEIVKLHCLELLKDILKFGDTTTLLGINTLSDIGLDSLMLMEFRNKLQTYLGPNVNIKGFDLSSETRVDEVINFVTDAVEKHTK